MKRIVGECRLSLLLLPLAIGCGSAGAWRYQPSTAEVRQPLAPSRVAVLPFEDRRPEGNLNLFLLYLIPVNPIGPFSYNQIEGGSTFLTHGSYQIRPGEDLAKAVVSELHAAQVFEEVFYTEREREPDVDFLLRGYVDDLRYEGKIISYGLSVYGPILWFLGLPAGHAKNSIKVGLELARFGEATPIWRSNPDRSETTVTTGLYYNWGNEFNGYPTMMHAIASHWAKEISSFVGRNPSEFEN